ncbi:MAG: gliding motility-associated ABC transporter substrate-binding protein GldG [Flavobacteriaceae bacterium]|nr:gliding motility-associated ABC transporter substrate-binding protein GldG [Flavobacteriaceae bacterium]
MIKRLKFRTWIVILLSTYWIYHWNLIDYQLDLTSDKRYSLSSKTKEFIDSIDQSISIDVLLTGNLPPSFLRLKSELNELLKSVERLNPLISFSILDRRWLEKNEAVISVLDNMGVQPHYVFENKRNITNQITLYPWILVHGEEKSIPISLLPETSYETQEEDILKAIEQLELHLVEGIYQAWNKKNKNIAVLSSHKTSEQLYITDFLLSLKGFYNIASFDFKAEQISNEQTLENLDRFDILVVSNPIKSFSIEEKFILDQFTCNGGKILWLINPLIANPQDLYANEQGFIPEINSLGLEDLFFKNQFRFQNQFVGDLYSGPVVLATGSNQSPQYAPFLYPYFPIIKPVENHPITNDINSVLMRLVSPIDTLEGKLDKTILLQSSSYSKLSGFPVNLNLKMASIPINPESFIDQNFVTGVLLEGRFESLFKNRVHPFKPNKYSESGEGKWVVLSDGNFAENQTDRNEPLPLGFDKWTNINYENKQFLTNIVHYLADVDEILSLNRKQIRLSQINQATISGDNIGLKSFMLILPFVFIGIFWLCLNYMTGVK